MMCYEKHLFISVLLCLTLKIYFCKAQCIKPTGGDHMVLDDSDIIKDSFESGALATFKCVPGYVRDSGNGRIKCEGTSWLKLTLTCTKRPCGHPGDLPDGRYVFSPEGEEGLLFGATATAVCNKGYRLTSQISKRNCVATGWDGRTPTCEVVKCEAPPAVVDGNLVDPPQEVYEYGQAVTYTCNDGYTLYGRATIACSENGKFQPDPPQCLDVSCERPVVTNGVRVSGGSGPYTYKSTLQFKCKDGYRMNGPAEITCEIEGWDPSPPECLALSPKPSATPVTRRPESTTKTSTEKGSDDDHPSNNIGKIVGGVIGGLAGLAVIAGVLYYLTNKNRTGGAY
ncbi:C4b-binding protein alpha chain isoform X2 [Chanos chanos]|uniref:C4b-binding protein alpha chain isoform X2 n=1 Tax=Chanos chanos TaxID=29144 RepID=A0A6J2UWZ0_CHACN|nr:C4b-binding protein alpha chain-like isoform X2 [Chanos chanos]